MMTISSLSYGVRTIHAGVSTALFPYRYQPGSRLIDAETTKLLVPWFATIRGEIRPASGRCRLRPRPSVGWRQDSSSPPVSSSNHSMATLSWPLFETTT